MAESLRTYNPTSRSSPTRSPCCRPAVEPWTTDFHRPGDHLLRRAQSRGRLGADHAGAQPCAGDARRSGAGSGRLRPSVLRRTGNPLQDVRAALLVRPLPGAVYKRPTLPSCHWSRRGSTGTSRTSSSSTAAGMESLALASPTVYDRTIRHGETGLIYHSLDEFTALLDRLIRRCPVPPPARCQCLSVRRRQPPAVPPLPHAVRLVSSDARAPSRVERRASPAGA